MTNTGVREGLGATWDQRGNTLTTTDRGGGGSVSQQLRQRPLLVVGAVVALGYLLGASLGSRSRRRRSPTRWLDDAMHGYGRPMTTHDFAHRHSGAIER
jgi:hypothetical protein